jgi:hypothetical protein
MGEASLGNQLTVGIDDGGDVKPASQIDPDEQR